MFFVTYRPTTSKPFDPNQNGDGDNQNREQSNGEEKGNLLHYLGYRKEDRSCPEGWVMDIYGYCRLNY